MTGKTLEFPNTLIMEPLSGCSEQEVTSLGNGQEQNHCHHIQNQGQEEEED